MRITDQQQCVLGTKTLCCSASKRQKTSTKCICSVGFKLGGDTGLRRLCTREDMQAEADLQNQQISAHRFDPHKHRSVKTIRLKRSG